MTLSKKWLEYFMAVSFETANLSYAQRLKVGCVAVKEKRIILCGFNGTPPGMNNVCEDSEGKTLPFVIHAEENLILFSAKTGISLKDSSIFITHSPCPSCSRMILGSGISEVYFKHSYRDLSGLDFLRGNGIKIIQLY